MVAYGIGLLALVGASPRPHDCIDRCTAQTDGVHLEAECYEACMAEPDRSPATTPDTAPRTKPRRAITNGGYIYAVPGIVNVPLAMSGYPTRPRVSWGWGVGGGYLWTPTRHFKAALGLAFEHWPMRLDVVGYTGNHFRWMPELRLGGGSDIVWGYGLVAPGVVLSVVTVPDRLAPDELVGFDMKIGGGVQGAVWRGLFFGGEVAVDVAELPEPGLATLVGDPLPPDYRTAVLWLRLIAGWSF